MTDKMALAQELFGTGRGGSFVGMAGGGYGGKVGASTIYATALSNSAGGSVQIDIGGTPINASCICSVIKGQRVLVSVSGTTMIVIGVVGWGDRVDNSLLVIEEEVKATGAKITAEVQAEVKPVRDAFDAFRLTHTLTDTDITRKDTDTKTELSTQITGAIKTADEAYTASTQAKQTVDTLSLSATEHYNKYDKGMVDLDAALKINAKAITTEITDRTTAVSGAVSTAKSYTDQQAGSISQTVEANVKNSLGATYATKSEVSQSATDITTTFDTKLSGVTSTANGAYNAASSASSGVTTLRTYIRESAQGIEVGKTNGAAKALVNANGSFDVLDKTGATITSLGMEDSYMCGGNLLFKGGSGYAGTIESRYFSGSTRGLALFKKNVYTNWSGTAGTVTTPGRDIYNAGMISIELLAGTRKTTFFYEAGNGADFSATVHCGDATGSWWYVYVAAVNAGAMGQNTIVPKVNNTYSLNLPGQVANTGEVRVTSVWTYTT